MAAALDSVFPMTLGTPCGRPGDGGAKEEQTGGAVASQADLRALPLHANHASRPLWVCPNGHIILEAFHPKASDVSDFLIAIAELVSRPELVHEYQITTLSLSAAISTGVDAEQILRVLTGLSKTALSKEFEQSVRNQGRTIGKLRLVLRDNKHFLEASDTDLFTTLCQDPEIANSILHTEQLLSQNAVASAGAGPGQQNVLSAEINSLRIENVKAAAHRLNLPLLQEYEYVRDFAASNPELPLLLKPAAKLRPYQQHALSKVFSLGGLARSGMVVLPCGAGKTLVGVATACRIKRRTLVLTTTSVSVDQWRRQFLQWTTLPPDDIYMLTAEHKRPIQDAERRACVLISTYSMMGFGGRRSEDTELIMSQVQQLEWGLMIVDEVQVMPARTFRSVATTVKAHCSLGLTATLVREDNLIYDLHWLIGPKLYEASWQQLQEDGFIARVRCIEVWCDMQEAFWEEYLQAIDSRDEALRRALWTCNPSKLNICEYLIRYHERRGDKIIVFSDNIFILEEFAKRLGRYYICGKVDMRERMQILSSFQENPTCNTIFLSKVGDNAIDIPAANVLIQISSHYGSRRQEAQRLGRILRPKSKASQASGKYNAFFYSLVSRDTQEIHYANRRQQFLIEQGYNYHVLRDRSVEEMNDGSLVYASHEARIALLKQVLESVRQGQTREAEDEEVGVHDSLLKPDKTSAAGKVARPRPSDTPQDQQGGDAEVSLASLSGGLDGNYTVTSRAVRRRVKPENSALGGGPGSGSAPPRAPA